jgi:hypothetical protein
MRWLGALLYFAFASSVALAHVGSPDAYLDAKAGPYQLFITVQPPAVIPGVAQVQVRVQSPGVEQIRAAPLAMTGAGAKYAPVPDLLARSKGDAQYYTGSLWLMSSGSDQIRFEVTGNRGKGVVALPLPAIAQRAKTMESGLGLLLFGLMAFLVLGLVAVSGAAVREAQLEPGAAPGPATRRRSRIVMATVFLLLVGIIWLGRLWWNNEAGNYGRIIYKPLEMQATLTSPDTLTLKLSDPGWLLWRKVDDFIPDHNHLMHLYVIRQPQMDRIYHLHPEMTGSGVFQLRLPDMSQGDYRLYADVVHEDGFPETLVSSVTLPDVHGVSLANDDASAIAPPVREVSRTATTFDLPNGYRMLWLNGAGPQKAKHPELFKFQLVDPKGRAPNDMALYMGMLGHAAFVKTDGSVFAHIHPNGSIAMAAFMMASGQTGTGMMNMDHASHHIMTLPNEVSFPYGFPEAGHYRIIVQMKQGASVETGVFDAWVE